MSEGEIVDAEIEEDEVVIPAATAEDIAKVLPFWEAGQMPKFLERTKVQYGSLPFSEALNQRGLENEMLNQLAKILPDGAVISGGFMNAVMLGHAEMASDIDLFFTGPGAFLKTYDLLVKPPKKDAPKLQGYTTETTREELLVKSKELRFVKFKNADPKRPPIQLVKLVWYDSTEHVLDSFDFTCVQFAVCGEALVFNPIGMVDLARKRIVLHRMQFPVSTLRRLVKYAKKGFYACPGSLARIASETTTHMLENPGAEQFAYLD